MKIFADRNILAVEDRFSRHGELHLFDGRNVNRESLIEADALLVRSITAVDEALLAGTKIRFVGTATSGIDHIDTDYLVNQGIGFAHAKGSNANAVVDYCFAALAYAVLHKGFSLQGSRVGIVGAGAVGSIFASRLEDLGVSVRCCDPLLANEDTGRVYYSLAEALECEVLSLHVPLTRTGPHPTSKMIGSNELRKLRGAAVLINTCRGLVVDEAALKEVLTKRNDIVTVFDVWADEPTIDTEVARAVDIATPHIAGYSLEAKLKATEILARAFEDFFNLGIAANAAGERRAPDIVKFEVQSESLPEWRAVLQTFPVHELSAQFKAEVDAGAGVAAFDSFRKQLLARRESNAKLLECNNYSASQLKFLKTLGFRFV